MIRPYSATVISAGEQGATAVEYAMLVALIAAVIIATVAVLGGTVADAFESVIGLF